MHAYRHLQLSASLVLLLGCGGQGKPAAEYPTAPRNQQASAAPATTKPSRPAEDDAKPPAPRPPAAKPGADQNQPLSKEAAAELEKFQGTWLLTKYDVGTPTPEPVTGQLVITGSKYVITLNGQSNPGSLRIDPTKSPKEIDAVAGDGSSGHVTRLAGLYELDGDTQRTIFGSDGGPRPKDFTVTHGSGRQLYVFKKKEPEKPAEPPK